MINPEQIEAELAHLTEFLPGRIDSDYARAEIEDAANDYPRLISELPELPTIQMRDSQGHLVDVPIFNQQFADLMVEGCEELVLLVKSGQKTQEQCESAIRADIPDATIQSRVMTTFHHILRGPKMER